ncbi:MAG: ABC transporter ATP-binding protein, partial [Nitrososphaerota archaeon]
LIKDLSKTHGKTVIYCTHLLHEVRDVCDRVAFMNQGKVVALDTIPNLIAKVNASPDASLESVFIRFYEGV